MQGAGNAKWAFGLEILFFRTLLRLPPVFQETSNN